LRREVAIKLMHERYYGSSDNAAIRDQLLKEARVGGSRVEIGRMSPEHVRQKYNVRGTRETSRKLSMLSMAFLAGH
jgi:hypothetical protein